MRFHLSLNLPPRIDLGKFFFAGIAFAVRDFSFPAASDPDLRRPILSRLDEFESAPDTGPGEAEMPVRAVPTNSITMTWPGNGLAATSVVLYYGEGNNVLYVVNDQAGDFGVIPCRRAARIDDAWMLSGRQYHLHGNGCVL